jgi:uncharacterized protein YacL
MGATILEYLGWFFLTVLKFLITPSTMIGLGYSWIGTIITVFVSAFIGFICFFNFGEVLFKYLEKRRKKPRNKFSRMNRFIVKMKTKYGLLGMGLISGMISVPIAGLLASRYFRDDKKAIPAFTLAFLLWTVFLTSISWVIKYIFHGSI